LKVREEPLDATASTTGWYTFRIRSVNPPAANPQPSYTLTVTYQAPQEMCSGGAPGTHRGGGRDWVGEQPVDDLLDAIQGESTEADTRGREFAEQAAAVRNEAAAEYEQSE
jgi:hypothetical protein